MSSASPDSGIGSTASKSALKLRLVQLNAWSGLNYRGWLRLGEHESAAARRQRRTALLAQLQALAPDVVVLHEINGLPHAARSLADELGLDVVYYQALAGVRVGSFGIPVNLREGDLILARRGLRCRFASRTLVSGGPVGNHAAFHFSDVSQVLAAELEVSGRRIVVFATHWHSSILLSAPVRDVLAPHAAKHGREAMRRIEHAAAQGARRRLREAIGTLQLMRSTAGEDLCVLMGDLNATPDCPEVALLRQAGLIDAFAYVHPHAAGYTWDPEANLNQRRCYAPQFAAILAASSDLSGVALAASESEARRIDYVLVGPAYRVRCREIDIATAEVRFRDPVSGVHASDHFGLCVEVILSGHREHADSNLLSRAG
ncbi:MAG: endonuclease/exonuclease/phosphatase family protein [Candidatus Schekmanbacteria bacterium]|nr:endonuclease/exonuclease/phosphatase family protein [Candidatus Schekmanbacteria bacterium]